MSTPFSINRKISSLSLERHAARNTQPDENFTFLEFGSLGWLDARFVSESSHRFNCSARFDTAELLRVSNDMLNVFFFKFYFYFISWTGFTCDCVYFIRKCSAKWQHTSLRFVFLILYSFCIRFISLLSFSFFKFEIHLVRHTMGH